VQRIHQHQLFYLRSAGQHGLDVLLGRLRGDEQRSSARVGDVRDGVMVALDVLEAELRVHRHGHAARVDRAEKREHELVRVWNDERDAIAPLDASCGKVRAAAGGLLVDRLERAEALASIRPYEHEAFVILVRERLAGLDEGGSNQAGHDREPVPPTPTRWQLESARARLRSPVRS
jgi:hypothetical protein